MSIKPFKGLYSLFKQLYSPFKELYSPFKELYSPFKGLIDRYCTLFYVIYIYIYIKVFGGRGVPGESEAGGYREGPGARGGRADGTLSFDPP